MKVYRFLYLLLMFSINGGNLFSQSIDCNLTLKTTIQGYKVYKHNTSGAIMFRAKYTIDADGSPRAYGPNNSGLDYTANAGSPGNWWGIVTNSNGTPVIQGASDPFPGMYVSSTSLVNGAYNSKNPLRYVNSETIPFFVLPSAVTQLANIQLGDIGYVYNTQTGQGCYAIFADSGPAGKLGEGSIYLANQIGVNSNARTGGTTLGIIDYVVFPGSGSGQGVHKSIAEINTIGNTKMTAAGGNGIVNCLNTNGCGVPTGLSTSAISSSAATLSWIAVSGAQSYNIVYTSSLGSITKTSTTNSLNLTGLTTATQYQFKVQAVCGGSNTGAFSGQATFTTNATSLLDSTSTTNSTITIGTATTPYSAHPFSTVYMDQRVQYIIKKSELVTAGWSSASPYLKSLAFYVSSAAPQSMGSFKITVAHATNSNFTSTTFLSGTNSSVVYTGTVNATQGWNTFNFTNPFNYNGSSNLLITICWDNSSFSSNSTVNANSYSSYMALYYRADLSTSGPCSKTSGTRSYYRPNVQLAFSSTTSLSTPQGLVNNPLAHDTQAQRSFEIHPNPLDGGVLSGILSDTDQEFITLEIYDLMGRELLSQNVLTNEGSFSINLSPAIFPSGIYNVIGIAEEEMFVKKLVIK